MTDALSPIPASVLRNLSDKLYEKRKNAARDIEGIVRQLVSGGDRRRIMAVINLLTTEFTYSPQANQRKGGLIALAATTVGLAAEAAKYLEYIIGPVLNSFYDQDSRVRYYACEALYNIAKVLRGDIISYFNQIFDALCKLSADSDPNVQSATHLLDRLVKDVVAESDQFSIEEFIPLLRDRMNVLNPFVRQFLVGWIIVLDSVPDIDMLGFLPDFLDGLFNMLSDSSLEIRQQADSALFEFLLEMKNSPSVDYRRMIEILVQRTTAPEEFIQLTALTWINELVKLGGDQLVPYYADILGAILPSIAHGEEKIKVVAHEVNQGLLAIIGDPADELHIGSILSVIKRQLSSKWDVTRIEALHWIATLLSKYPHEVFSFLDGIYDSLLEAMFDYCDKVVLLVLDIYACIARDPSHFHKNIVLLLHKFQSNYLLLEKRGVLIICRLCVLLDADRVYRELSAILEGEDDMEFASIMIQALNLILLTSGELIELRLLLKKSLINSAGKDLFVSLYRSWCHSPVALISLCLLAQAYQHTNSIIHSLVDEDKNIKFYMELNKLIHLLEAPTFAYLRLQLLEPGEYGWLLRSLYSLLMLQPQQSAAFKILHTRLKTVSDYTCCGGQLRRMVFQKPSLQVLQQAQICTSSSENDNLSKAAADAYNEINFSSLLQLFKCMQQRRHANSIPQTIS